MELSGLWPIVDINHLMKPACFTHLGMSVFVIKEKQIFLVCFLLLWWNILTKSNIGRIDFIWLISQGNCPSWIPSGQDLNKRKHLDMVLSVSNYIIGQSALVSLQRNHKEQTVFMLVYFPFWQHEKTGLKLSFMNEPEVGSHCIKTF